MAVKPFTVMNLGQAGLFEPKEMGYRDSLDIIKDESVKIQKSFVKIGWYLKHIRDDQMYTEGGYANIYECAADQLGYSQSTVSRFINICEKFSKDKDSPELDERYAGFDKSQMIEMLPLEQDQLEKVTPDMTVRQIRDIAKESKKKKTRNIDETNDMGEADLVGQMNIEEDFPEYLPDTSYSECIDSQVEGTGKETETISDMTHPKLPALKNIGQRKEWLGKYKEWGLWYRDENIDVNYYKFDFDDGSRLVVAEYPQRYQYWTGNREDEYQYHLLEKEKQGYDKKKYDEVYRHNPDSETYLVEFLKNIQKKER